MTSNNGNPLNGGDLYGQQLAGANPSSGVKGTTKPKKKPAATSSSSSSGGGYSGGGSSSGGGGGGMPEAPTKHEARAIVMAGMKDYLGREASKKEVAAFFKKFTDFAAENDNNVSSGVQDEFMQDWIEDRPKLRKEYAQYSVATRYMDAFDRALSSAKEL